MIAAENPLPIYERLSYLIYAGALLALFCIVHEPEQGSQDLSAQIHPLAQQIEPSRDLPPTHRQPASAPAPLTNRDSLQPETLLPQQRIQARNRQSGMD